MSRNPGRVLAFAILSIFFTGTGLALPPVSPRPTGASPANPDTRDRSWLLRPDVFRRLSAGGQRAALFVNGKLPKAPAAAVAPLAVARGTSLAAPPVPRQNVRVNDPAQDEFGHTNSESSIAVRGSRIVVGFNDAAQNFSGYGLSVDGGATFVHRRVPPPADGYTFGDPVVAFGPAGEVYYSMLTLIGGGQDFSIGVSKSTDGGSTFSTPVDAAGIAVNGYSSQDKPWLAVDTGSTSPRAGTLYVSWTYFGNDGSTGILFTRSTDGGATFFTPGVLSPPDGYGVQNSTMAVAPNGDLYLAFEDGHIAPDGISLFKSTDGGASFAGPKAIVAFRGLSTLTGIGGVRASSYPTLAVDGSAGVYLAFTAPSANATLDRSDLVFMRSTDGGATFATPRILNDDGTNTTQAFPSIAATADGIVGVKWADRRNDPANDGLTDVYMTISLDHGATFGRNFRVTDQSFPYGPIESSLSAGYHGDYDGLAVDGGNFYLSWSDERGSDPDVYFASVPASFDGSTPDFGLTAARIHGGVARNQAITFDLSTFGTSGFTGSLSLLASATGVGVTPSLSSASVAAGGAVRLTVAASSSAQAGPSHVTVTATANGIARSVNLWVDVYGARPSGLGVPVNLTSSPGFTGSAGVKADSGGTLHLAYEDDSLVVLGEDVFTRRSTDGGKTFSNPLKLNDASTYGIDTVLATGPNGRLHVAWAGGTADLANTRVYVARSTDGGASFSTAVAVTPAGGFAQSPSIGVDTSGNVWIAYYDLTSGAPQVETIRSTDGGATFDSPSAIQESNASTLTRPGLAFDSKGATYVAYTRQVLVSGILQSTIGLAIARSGRTFAAPTTASAPASTTDFAPAIATSSDDKLLVSFYNRQTLTGSDTVRQIQLAVSTDGGATFGPPASVSTAGYQSTFADVVAEPSGAIDVVWEDTFGNDQMDILASRSTDGGKTFATPVNLSGTRGLSGSVANPLESAGGSGRAVASLSGSTLLVSWLDDSPANPDIFFLSFDPAAALSNRPPVVSASLVTPVPAEAGTTVVVAVGVVDPDGDPFVVTTDFGDGAGGAVVTGVGNLSHVYAVPGTYTITVTATDSHGAVGSATVPPFRIVEPTASGASLLLPVVLDAPGLGGSRYASEVTIASRAGTPTDVILRYTASQGGGSGFARLTIQPGQQLTLPNFLRGYLRGKGLPIADDDATKVGTLLAVFSGAGSASNFFLGARTFTPAPSGGGTFGLFYPAAGSTTASATIFGLQQNDAQRSNLALVNAGADPITLRVALSGPNGEDLGTLPDQTLGAYGWTQIGQPLLGKAPSGRAVVTRVSGTSPFTAYGVLNDAVTSDGSFLPPILSTDTSGSDLLVPIVLDVQGLGARFRTELTLVNTTPAPLPLNLSYVAATGFGSGSGSVSLTLGPLEQRIVPDAIVLLRGTLPIEADGRDVGGSLLVSAPAGTADGALAVGARTYVPASPSGTFGLFYRGLASGESASDIAFIYGLEENDAQRSNLALVNRGDAGDVITLRVTLFAADGTTTGAPIDRTLAPGEWVQLGRPLLTIGASAGYAKIQRVSGSSRFVAYGVLNDNVTSDGSYIPMSL